MIPGRGHFEVTICACDGSAEATAHGVYAMRYLHLPELDALFARTSFERSRAWAWMSDEAPSNRHRWSCVAAISP